MNDYIYKMLKFVAFYSSNVAFYKIGRLINTYFIDFRPFDQDTDMVIYKLNKKIVSLTQDADMINHFVIYSWFITLSTYYGLFEFYYLSYVHFIIWWNL